ncbi:MAG: response regulator [Acidobacteriota bacterium]
MAKGHPLKEVLSSLCLLIERDVDRSLCSVLLVQDGVLRLGAGPSLPEDYACGMDGMEIVDGIGPCGTAAYRAEPAIFGDIATSELAEETRQFILGHDVRACWSVPLFNAQATVVGTFAISCQRPQEPSSHQIELLRSAGFLAGIAISRHQEDLEHRRMEKELMQRQKLESLGVMAGGIAHDFNNLLTAIIGSLSLLERETHLSDGGHRRLQLALKAAGSATDLTTEMLTYAGLASVELGEIDLIEEIHGVIEVVGGPGQRAGGAIERPAVTFTTYLDEASRYLYGDASQVRQVIHNLIQNGVDAAPSAGGAIDVWLRALDVSEDSPLFDVSGAAIPAGRYTVLGVRDYGEGIAPERLAQVFDPFFSSKKSGRGLGLAMVLGGSRAHDGHIHLASTVGAGTTIQVLFPASRRLERPANLPRPRAAEASPAPESRALTFLLVEDDRSIRELVSDILREEGWTVHSAADGLEGWEQWRRLDGVDAVFLDRCMPGLSGDELMERIRRDAPGIPIVITSGYGVTSMSELLDQGVDAILPKPFTSEKLLDLVRRLTAPSSGKTQSTRPRRNRAE